MLAALEVKVARAPAHIVSVDALKDAIGKGVTVSVIVPGEVFAHPEALAPSAEIVTVVFTVTLGAV